MRVLTIAALDACAIAYHYGRLGGSAAAGWLESGSQAKTYFYALWPALVFRCLRRNPAARMPRVDQLIRSGLVQALRVRGRPQLDPALLRRADELFLDLVNS